MLLSERKLRSVIRRLLKKSMLNEAVSIASSLSDSEAALKLVVKRGTWQDFFNESDVSATGLTPSNIKTIASSVKLANTEAFIGATRTNLLGGFGTDEKELKDLFFKPLAQKIASGEIGLLNVAEQSKDVYNNGAGTSMLTFDDLDVYETLIGDGATMGSTGDELSGNEFVTYCVAPFDDVISSDFGGDINKLPFYVIKGGETIDGTTIAQDTPVTIGDVLNGDFLGAGNSGGGTSGGGTPLDPATVSGSNTIEKIENVLDKYVDDKIIPSGGSDPLPAFAPDPNWDSDTDTMYVPVINHGFQNHPTFSTIPNAGTYGSAALNGLKWKSIVSPDLRGEGYPGCTNDAAGLLNFLVDLYNGDTTYSSAGQSGGGSGGSGGSGGGGNSGAVVRSGNQNQAANVAATKTVNVEIRDVPVNQNLNTLEGLGFPQGTTDAVKKIPGDKSRGSNMQSGTFNFKVRLNKSGKVVRVRPSSGQRSTRSGYENFKKAIQKTLQANDGTKLLADNFPKLNKRSFQIVIKVS